MIIYTMSLLPRFFHPSRDGAGSLYTVEHFQAIRQRLTPDGLFCQWLPLFQLDIPTLRLITRSFLQVFPQAQLHLAHFSLRQPLLCLLGGQGEISFSDNWLLPRVHDRNLQQQLVQARLNSDFALFGGFLAGASALTKFTQGVPLNTDDFSPRYFSSAEFRLWSTPVRRANVYLSWWSYWQLIAVHCCHLISDTVILINAWKTIGERGIGF